MMTKRRIAPAEEAFPERRGMKNPKGIVLDAKIKYPGLRMLHGYRWVCLSCKNESNIYQDPDTIRKVEEEHYCGGSHNHG